jgi:alpha-aminoadipic semialdehyde synthase
MVDALWALGRRLATEGVATPFAAVRQAKDYESLEAALDHLAHDVAREIREHGLPDALRPLVIGFTGGGNVSQGAQEVLRRLPVVEIHPSELPELEDRAEGSHRTIYKVVFRREDRVDFARHLPHLTVMVNGIFWDPRDPRLVTWNDLDRLWSSREDDETPRLRVLADLSCDVEGSVEATVEQTDPDRPVFVADPTTRSTHYGVEGRGPVILAVGNLPAEFPRDASEHFGDSLFPFLAPLAAADFGAPFEHLTLPAPLRDAVICHGGELAPGYRHLAELLERVPA